MYVPIPGIDVSFRLPHIGTKDITESFGRFDPIDWNVCEIEVYIVVSFCLFLRYLSPPFFSVI